MHYPWHLAARIIGLPLLFVGCLSTKYLQENEYLLVKQRIRGNRQVSASELTPYYLQRSHLRPFTLPIRVWIYQFGKTHFCPARIQRQMQHITAAYEARLAVVQLGSDAWKRLQRRRDKQLAIKQRMLEQGNICMRWGHPPVLYDPERRARTEQNLLSYLRSQGYFEAEVVSNVQLNDKSAYITYQISEHAPYHIGSICLHTADAALQQQLDPYTKQSLLQVGDRYDQTALANERTRIRDLLLNAGYWGFSEQYIHFNVDTTGAHRTVHIETVVDPPANSTAHLNYHLDTVLFSVNPQKAQATSEHEGIVLQDTSQRITPHTIASKISLRPGQAYSLANVIETQSRLSQLDMFEHIHITHQPRGTDRLATHIDTRLAKRFQLENEMGIQVSETTSVPQPFYKLSVQGRNVLKRLELLKLDVKINLERMPTHTHKLPVYNSQTYQANVDLTMPQFFLPISRRWHHAWDAYRPTTQTTLGGTLTRTPDHRKISTGTALRYAWKTPIHGADWHSAATIISYAITPLSIELTRSERVRAFASARQANQVQQHNVLKNDHYSLISHLSLRATVERDLASYTSRPSLYLSLGFESGGTLQNLVDFRKLISQKLAYYKYLKLDIKYSQRIALGPQTVWAYQALVGLAYPYDTGNALPPSKGYDIGGSYGIRAWPPQGLGPGSYRLGTDLHKKRSGEMILQGNVELRQSLVGFIEGALFMDFGNTWMLKAGHPVGQAFSWHRFYKEMAMGTGVGLRLNLWVFVLRLDVGLKLYDPAKPRGSRLFPADTWKGLTHFNMVVGYPF
ncbi:MAG: BamA/TamA family outer membrane protein [Bacteroidota bacterium]